MAKSQKKIRVEIWITKSDSRIIRDNICKINETRKQAIERIVSKEIDRVVAKQAILIM